MYMLQGGIRIAGSHWVQAAMKNVFDSLFPYVFTEGFSQLIFRFDGVLTSNRLGECQND